MLSRGTLSSLAEGAEFGAAAQCLPPESAGARAAPLVTHTPKGDGRSLRENTLNSTKDPGWLTGGSDTSAKNLPSLHYSNRTRGVAALTTERKQEIHLHGGLGT